MIELYKRFFFIFILLILQSCSGGKIGNFLESSFENIEEEIQIENNLVDANKNTYSSEIDILNEVNLENEDNSLVTEEINDIDLLENIGNDFDMEENNYVNDDFETNSNYEELNSEESKINYESYRIILILKDADPTSPIESLTKILREYQFNFEIEKIERYSETNEQN
tara:strand:- start:180 stop:686 length:507 start_codon:yes stop_codon:yes gene_type:complete